MKLMKDASAVNYMWAALGNSVDDRESEKSRAYRQANALTMC